MAEPDGPSHGPHWGPKEAGPPRQLVVLCHGVGADGHDLIDLAPHWAHALPHAAFLSPDGPERYEMAPMGRQWFSIADRSPGPMQAGAAAASLYLDRLIDAELARLGLPATEYALMGFSQGAMMALYAGLRRPTPPRGILAFSGALLAPDTVAALPGRPPVLLLHGDADEVVPAERSRDAERVLRAAGVPVESLFRPGLGHGIDDVELTTGALFLQRVFASS